MAEDVIPIFNRHLENIGEQKKISLFIYTRGGDMVTPLRLVKLIRSYCNEFEVLIPYRCHSAGTLIALGAHKVVMGKLGELSPVDPVTMHPYNPQNPLNPQQRLEISVEDLNSYFLLAREMAKVKEEGWNSEFVNALFRVVHSIKSSADYMGFESIKNLAKEEEKLLEKVRKKEITPSEELTSLFTSSYNILTKLIDNIRVKC